MNKDEIKKKAKTLSIVFAIVATTSSLFLWSHNLAEETKIEKAEEEAAKLDKTSEAVFNKLKSCEWLIEQTAKQDPEISSKVINVATAKLSCPPAPSIETQ